VAAAESSVHVQVVAKRAQKKYVLNENFDSLRSADYELLNPSKGIYRRRNNQHTEFAPMLYSIRWLLHVSAVVCHLQGAAGCF
jgi:hypothetical protein